MPGSSCILGDRGKRPCQIPCRALWHDIASDSWRQIHHSTEFDCQCLSIVRPVFPCWSFNEVSSRTGENLCLPNALFSRKRQGKSFCKNLERGQWKRGICIKLSEIDFQIRDIFTTILCILPLMYKMKHRQCCTNLACNLRQISEDLWAWFILLGLSLKRTEEKSCLSRL